MRLFDSPRAFSTLPCASTTHLRSFSFHATPLSVPSRLCGARLAPPPARFPPLFSRTPGVRFALPQKRIHRQHDEQCCRWILFSRRGLSWHRRRLIYIMVWRERGNRPYRRHFSPRTVPAVPYLKETPPWNTRKTPFALFCSAREKKKARIPSPEHLSSFFEPLPLRSTQRSQFNLLHHFCVIFTQIVPQSQKRNTPHSYFSYAHQFFFHIFAYTFPNCIPTLLLILFRLNLETTQKNGFRRTQFGEIRIKP